MFFILILSHQYIFPVRKVSDMTLTLCIYLLYLAIIQLVLKDSTKDQKQAQNNVKTVRMR